MHQDKFFCIIISLSIIGIAGLIVYKNMSDSTDNNSESHSLQSHHSPHLDMPTFVLPPLQIENFTQPPTTTAYTVQTDMQTYLDSRYNEIQKGQYDNISRQNKLDTLTDRMNTLNSELQKHVNTNLTYQASGELNFY